MTDLRECAPVEEAKHRRYRLHMCATKQFLIDGIRRYGAGEVLTNFQGTDEEAISAIEADPREVIATGDCDNFDETGRCKGHPEGL